MLVKELIAELKEYGVPDDAEVLIEADHGQNKEYATGIFVSRTHKDTDYFGDPDAMIFEFSNWKECYDEDTANYDGVD